MRKPLLVLTLSDKVVKRILIRAIAVLVSLCENDCQSGFYFAKDLIMEGFIKLYRSLLDWEWYGDINTRLVFIHLLLNANWEQTKYMGHDIPRGGLVVGLNSLSESIGISVQSVRTALNHLKSTGEITIKSTNKFSIITIANWEKYQGFSEEVTSKPTSKLTNNQQTTNKQLTTEEEYNNTRIKEGNNIGEKSKRFVPPTVEEVRAYCNERNNTVDPETFINFYESKGWFVGKNKMKDWRACVRTWERNRKETKSYDITDKQKNSQEKGYQNGSNADFLKMLEEESRR